MNIQQQIAARPDFTSVNRQLQNERARLNPDAYGTPPATTPNHDIPSQSSGMQTDGSSADHLVSRDEGQASPSPTKSSVGPIWSDGWSACTWLIGAVTTFYIWKSSSSTLEPGRSIFKWVDVSLSLCMAALILKFVAAYL